MDKTKFGSRKLEVDNGLLSVFSKTPVNSIEENESVEEISAQDLANELLEKAKHSITSTERERLALSKITDALSNEQITEVNIELLDSFEDHTYTVEPDEAESMKILMRSISEQGLIHPVVITPSENGRYQVISGHRRTRACALLKRKTIPCVIKMFDDDEASKRKKRELMIDANVQRGGMKPSEKAKSYKMKVDNLKRQGQRSDLIEHGEDEKALSELDKKGKNSTYIQVALQEGDSRSEIYRYLRLNFLIDDLLFLVDAEVLPVRTAAEISFLPVEYQKELYDVIRQTDTKPTHAQVVQIKKAFQAGQLQSGDIATMMEKPKTKQSEKFFIPSEAVINYIPKGLSTKEISLYIEKALKFYLMHGTDRDI